MKQKLTRALIDEIRKEMPVLTEMEMRCCNGGDGGTTSWDCLFNCMHHMDPSRSAQDYANDYKDIYGLDPTAMGGVPNELIGNVLSVMGFGNTVPGSMTSNRDYYQVATMVNPDGTGHTIIVCRLGTRRLAALLRQVSESLPPNRAYTSPCTRLSITPQLSYHVYAHNN